jgi:hypothetical protein
MSKRIFAAYLEAHCTPITGAGATWFTGADSFLAEEDIVVVGSKLGCFCNVPNENDGLGQFYCELSQNGIPEKPGMINQAMAFDYWNTSPAGVQTSPETNVIMFPEGRGVSLREGESIYLHAHGYGKTAGDCSFIMNAILFYVKGKLATK